MDDKLKTFEEFYSDENIKNVNDIETEDEAIDDYADSLDSNVEIELTTALKNVFEKYGEDVVVDAFKRLYL